MSSYREEGRRITANDLAERLIPDLNMNEFLAWSPDLFALTSYILSYTGAYQLAISPPTGEKWEPSNQQLREWLGIEFVDGEWKDAGKLSESLTKWLKSFLHEKNAQNNNRNFWTLDCSNWTHFSTKNNTYFNERFVERLKKHPESQLETIVEGIVENINLYEHYSDDEKEKYSLGDLLKDDNGKDWTKFVQKLGETWKYRLNQIDDEEFQLINHSLADEDGVIFPIKDDNGNTISTSALSPEKYDKKYHDQDGNKEREKRLLGIILKYTPPLVLACWAFFYNEIENTRDEKGFPMNISDLLCNRDEIQSKKEVKNRLWRLCQCIFTLHAIADICCETWGIYPVGEKTDKNAAQWFAEKLLFTKGSLSTANPERGRVLPKRHNPSVGITLRSVSSNVAFHRSSVEVVWRRTTNTPLEKKLEEIEENNKTAGRKKAKTLSLMLFPFPLEVRARDFDEDKFAEKVVDMSDGYGFFEYAPKENNEKPKEINVNQIWELITEANKELVENRKVDIVVFPEGALNTKDYAKLEKTFENEGKNNQDTPSIFIAGVRESREYIWETKSNEEKKSLTNERIESLKLDIEKEKSPDKVEILKKKIAEFELKLLEYDKKEQTEIEIKEQNSEVEKTKEDIDKLLAGEIVNFSRNAVYCKYFNESPPVDAQSGFYGKETKFTRKYKQYKHHRWQLNSYQIKTYGLSQILNTDNNKIWWESMKVPRRRVSFLNVGKNMTISHLVCEDLARQDPIADLIRHVGPTLVVTLLMDGPQIKNRWSSRYASVLSDDPGSSVISLTSWGMVKRYQSSFGSMSRVIALWSQSDGVQREIELAEGAEAVLLNLEFEPKNEKTADGRIENIGTMVLKLVDVIQVYPIKN